VAGESEFGGRLTVGGGHADLIVSYYNAVTNVANSILRRGRDALSASFLGKYTVTEGPLNGLFFGGGVNGQGKRLELSYSYIETPTLVNVFAGYKINRNWSAQVNVDNLGDKRYIVAAAASGLVNTAPDAPDPGHRSSISGRRSVPPALPACCRRRQQAGNLPRVS